MHGFAGSSNDGGGVSLLSSLNNSGSKSSAGLNTGMTTVGKTSVHGTMLLIEKN